MKDGATGPRSPRGRGLLVPWLLKLFPRRFRSTYGEDMLSLYGQRLASARSQGLRSLWSLRVRTTVDLLWTALREHLRSSFAPFSSSPGSPRPPGGSRGDSMLAKLLYDLKLALRSLAHRPGFSLLVVVTLALGIGATTAIFSVVDGVLLQPLPYEDPDRLVSVWGRFEPESGFDFDFFVLSPPELVDLRQATRSLEAVGGYRTTTRTLTGGDGDPARLTAGAVTPEVLPMLGAEPLMGRAFTREEGLPDGPSVVILSEGLWRERFGADPDILDRRIRLDGEPARVVGVLGAGFDFPRPGIRLWVPLPIDPAAPGNRRSHYLLGIARLADGFTLAEAEAEMETLMARWQREYPEIHTGHYLFLRPRVEDVVGNVRPTLLTLLGASGLVLLLACANIASMVLARGEDRGRELAVRTALGAGRGRIVALLMIESLLLALAGGALGIALARLGVGSLLGLDAGTVPRAHAVGVDGGVLLFALAVTILTALLFGLVPALRASRSSPRTVLRETGRGVTGRNLGRTVLVAGEVALCFPLLLGAGLMVRSLDSLTRVDPGFRAEGLLAARMALPEAGYTDEEVPVFYRTLLERVRRAPGVSAAALGAGVPLLDGIGLWDFQIDGVATPGEGEQAWNAGLNAVYPGFFEALGIPLIAGRTFTDADRLGAEPVAVVNQELARRYFGDESPLEQRIRVAGKETWMRVVGVVGDVHFDSLQTEPGPRYYLAADQLPATIDQTSRTQYVVLRADGDPRALVPALRQVVRQADPELPIYDLGTLEEAVAESTVRTRFTGSLLGLFALVALGLGASGVYGLLAYVVARRRRELGVRKALGAGPRDMLGMVVRQGMFPVMVGLAAGGGISLWALRLLASQLFGVPATDGITWAGVAVVLGTTSLAACIVPGLRAAGVEAVVALRGD